MRVPGSKQPSSRAWAFVLALVLSLASCAKSKPQAGDEPADVTQFVANGSFEEMDGDNPKGWLPRRWQRAEAAFAVEPSGHSGVRSVMVSSEKGADASWLATVPVKPYLRYKLSGWIKTQDLVPGTSRGRKRRSRGGRSQSRRRP